MQIRRFTRLTNAFSKKWENHYAALSLYFVCYNFVRIHDSIRVTPRHGSPTHRPRLDIEGIAE
jgi:hypothetical protein